MDGGNGPEDDQLQAEEFFGFPLQQFLDDVFNALLDYLELGVNEISEALNSEVKRKKEVIRRGTDTFYNTLLGALEKNFDKFELYALRNILRIPTEVPLLPLDQVFAVGKKYKKSDGEEDLHTQFLAAKLVNFTLKKHKELLIRCKERLRDAVRGMDGVEKELIEGLARNTSQIGALSTQVQTLAKEGNELMGQNENQTKETRVRGRKTAEELAKSRIEKRRKTMKTDV